MTKTTIRGRDGLERDERVHYATWFVRASGIALILMVCGPSSATTPLVSTDLDPRVVWEIEDAAAGLDFARLAALIEERRGGSYYARAVAVFKALEEIGNRDAIEFLLRYAFGPVRSRERSAEFVVQAAQFFLKKHVLRKFLLSEQLAEYRQLLQDTHSSYPQHLVVQAIGELVKEGEERALKVLYEHLVSQQAETTGLTMTYALDQVARLAEADLLTEGDPWGPQFRALLEQCISALTEQKFENATDHLARAYFALATQGQTIEEKIDHIASFLGKERGWNMVASSALDQLPPEAAPILLEKAQDEEQSVEVRGRMLYSLGAIGDRQVHPEHDLSAMVPDLIAFLEVAEDPVLIRYAASALSKWQATESVPTIAEALKRLRSDHSEAAVYAKDALLNALSGMADASYIPFLLEFAKDETQSVYVRRNAAVIVWDRQRKAAQQDQSTVQEFLDGLGIVVPPLPE